MNDYFESNNKHFVIHEQRLFECNNGLFFKLPCWTDDDANGEKGPTLTKRELSSGLKLVEEVERE
jgi:hypothetical protein